MPSLSSLKKKPPVKKPPVKKVEAPKKELLPPREEGLLRLEAPLKKSILKTLDTKFGERAPDIIEFLEVGNNDSALTLISRSMLQTLVDILPVLEKNVRTTKGQRGVYQMNQVISQIREMCHDIQAYKDRSNIGQSIIDRFVRTAFLDLAVQVTSLMNNIEQSARLSMSKEDYQNFRTEVLEFNKRALADYMRRQYEELCKSILKSLG